MFNNKSGFTSAGKNRYFANEVDEYVRKSSEEYDSLLKKYRILEKKYKTLGPALEEYNNNKNTVFSAIVRAETYFETIKAQADESAAEIIKAATEDAEGILLTKKAEAEAYYYNLTHEADEKIIKLQEDMQRHSRLKITGMINNTNLAQMTTPADLRDGYEIVKQVSEITGVPVKYTSGKKELLDIFLAEGHDPKYIGTPIAIDTYMQRDWDSWIKGLSE